MGDVYEAVVIYTDYIQQQFQVTVRGFVFSNLEKAKHTETQALNTVKMNLTHRNREQD